MGIKTAVLLITTMLVLGPVCISPRPAGLQVRTVYDRGEQDTDRDGVKDSEEQALGLKFAPQLRFHPRESFVPISVESFLSSCRLCFEDGTGVRLIAERGMIGPTDLARQAYSKPPVDDGSNTVYRSCESSLFYLDLDEETVKGEGRCYMHVFPVRQNGGIHDTAARCDGVSIQYWFVYAGSQVPGYRDIAGHEGDWEHIELEISDSGAIKHAVYFRHGYHSSLLRTGDLTLVSGTHPVIYVALGTHASYEGPGRFGIETEFGNDLVYDVAENGDTLRWWNVWEDGGRLINVGELDEPMNGQYFIRYSGRWGEPGKSDFTSGPFGPAFNPYW